MKLTALFVVPAARVHLLRGDCARTKTLLIEGAHVLPPALIESRTE